MSHVKTFRLRDANTGEPKDDATPAIVLASHYVDRSGSPRTPPASVLNLGRGLYGVEASDDDVTVGTAVLVTCGIDVTPRHVVTTFCLPANPFHALVFEEGNGDLWAGAAPSVTAWKDGAGATLASPPGLVALVAPHFYAVIPTANELPAAVVYAVEGAPGCISSYDGSFHYEVSTPEMSTGEAIYAELVGAVGVTALIGTRIYPNLRPAEAALPLAVYSIISDIPENAFMGTAESRLSHARLQIDVYAKTYRQAHQVAAAIESVIANLARPDLSGLRDSVRDLYDNEAQLHRVSTDYTVSR